MDTKSQDLAQLLSNTKPLQNAATTGRWRSYQPASSSRVALHFSERRLLLVLLDLILVNTALLLSLIVRLDFKLSLEVVWQHLLWFMIWNGVWLAVGFLMDIYDLTRAANLVQSLWSSVLTAVIAIIIYSAIPYYTPSFPDRRLEVLIFPLLLIPSIIIWRWAYARFLVQPSFQRRVVVIGAGIAGKALAETIVIKGNPQHSTGYQVLGFIDDDPAKQGLEIEGVPVLGKGQDLAAVVKHLRPNELVVAINNSASIRPELLQAILTCQESGITVSSMPVVYERLTGKVPVEQAMAMLETALPPSPPSTLRVYTMSKRLLDIALGLLGCIFMLIVLPFIALANLLGSPGPLFYRQERVGKGGKTFSIIKFRSMVVNAEQATGAVWAKAKDTRITPVGLFLRKTRLDEIPQFWNILKGDMTLIGPRPERPVFVQDLMQQYPLYRVRHTTKPGLTGWAQVKYRYGASVQDALIKLQYDLYYIKHQGVLLDIQILLKTINVVLGLKGQ
jgi:exopolysaccharide biosynthesis polyprenyl glycosylphosphotransferase